MPPPIPALVNPPLLVWAREQSGYTPSIVAKKLAVKLDRLLAWERGERKPTVRQVEALSKTYHRPFGLFFLPQPPELPPLAAEYRRLPDVQVGEESPELRLAIRTMSLRREVALELTEALGASLLAFEISARLIESAIEVGARLRSALGVTLDEQLGWRDEWQAWRRWREAVENLGVLVFQVPKVPLTEMRGVSLLVFPTPAIGVNSNETAPGARSYTLMHELAHLALARTREEFPALSETRPASAWDRVERFTEEVASAVLIPQAALEDQLRGISVARDGWDVPRVRSLASRFRVTPLAMATRLRTIGRMTWSGYREWRDAWARYVRALPKRAAGFASPVDKTLGRAGRPFTQVVLEAMDTNRITAVQAARYLDLRFDHFERLRGELRKGTASVSAADDGV